MFQCCSWIIQTAAGTSQKYIITELETRLLLLSLKKNVDIWESLDFHKKNVFVILTWCLNHCSGENNRKHTLGFSLFSHLFKKILWLCCQEATLEFRQESSSWEIARQKSWAYYCNLKSKETCSRSIKPTLLCTLSAQIIVQRNLTAFRNVDLNPFQFRLSSESSSASVCCWKISSRKCNGPPA